MRDQYAGDVSDLLKFAFLRTLAADDRTIGVGWYYNPTHDGRVRDGRHRKDCDEPKWKSLDLVLFNALRKLSERSDQPICASVSVSHHHPVAEIPEQSWQLY